VVVRVPVQGNEWLEVGIDVLPVETAYEWAVLPHCGAVVLFSGTVRDHADGRTDVHMLSYEAFEEAVLPRFHDIAAEMRVRWPSIGRVVILHRLGDLSLGESSVLVVVSAPHRPEAFEAARYGIDALKASAPIWKKEHWGEGSDWGTRAQEVVSPAQVRSAHVNVEGSPAR